jgi:hypothetical protein
MSADLQTHTLTPVAGAPARVRPGWHRASLTAVAVAVVAGVALHTFGSVDPVNQMLSDTVASAPGAVLLGVAGAALVVAAGFLAVGARHSDRPGLIRTLLGLWTAGLVALAVFPTNLPGTGVTTGALVHRYGAALAVAVPPIVGLVAARGRRLRTASLVTGGAAMIYGAAHAPAMLTGAEVMPYAGLAERVVLALVLTVVVLTAAELRNRSRSWI